ncbi:hypothetical protein Nepgr_007186 [Nepenthes gracilis]|uniref:Uncharacterized protein n=1 Tax=Nepenthes gracilis TaxID=150966 RepID=A0AAD3S770_NEPGR|nr:hypothetical protein Nepgr_007186 [Nepenthes gracilis]
MAKKSSPSSSRVSQQVRHGASNTGPVLMASAIAASIVDYGIPSGMAYRTPRLTSRANTPREGFISSCVFDANTMKAVFCFTKSEDWISMSPRTGFHFWGTNPYSVKNRKNHFFFLQDGTFRFRALPQVGSNSEVVAGLEKKFRAITLQEPSGEDAGESCSLLETSSDEEVEVPLKRRREVEGTST